ncbi:MULTISPECIES: sensor domain-containing diguanylate cyclase [Amycolatopsis]|uniref:GGDEF domain-containing protein n=1 Tax=Amycolatopsis bullii TaxID=941987 RepID=A0ABQ3K5S2_9PSEU|nr:GGDEF domain-containing protein [Amycolatopsis bullii]GHF96630.1 GGDEF domain-containing protein [Amycolatopsis bullii]
MGENAGWAPSGWPLWALPGRVRVLVLGVVLAVFGLVALAARTAPAPEQWTAAGWLAAAALPHLHASHLVQRRRRARAGTPYLDLCSVWIFAGVIVLPLVLELALVAVLYAHRWVLVNRFDAVRPPHRAVFTAATLALAAAAAAGVLHSSGVQEHLADGARPGWADLAAVVAAAAVQWVVNTALVGTVIAWTVPAEDPRRPLGSASDNLLEVGQLALGVFVALALLWWPPAALLMIVPTFALHQCVQLDQLKLAARTDQRTGLLNAAAWHEQAERALERARGRIGVLMIDLDWFKRINDTHGHPVGDDVLAEVATALTRAVRRGDTVGRYGGEEFAVLLPDVDEAEVRAIAERIRRRIRALRITAKTGEPVTLSATIGAALHPAEPGGGLEGLIRAADDALYAGKKAGRDRVAVAAPQF